jgi:hypothetical protein
VPKSRSIRVCISCQMCPRPGLMLFCAGAKETVWWPLHKDSFHLIALSVTHDVIMPPWLAIWLHTTVDPELQTDAALLHFLKKKRGGNLEPCPCGLGRAGKERTPPRGGGRAWHVTAKRIVFSKGVRKCHGQTSLGAAGRSGLCLTSHKRFCGALGGRK